MSVQAVTDFLEQLKDEEDLKTELDIKGKTRQERIAAVVELAGKRGYGFTADECATVLETVQKIKAGELEDAELETVAGGVALPEGTWTSIKNATIGLILDVFGPDCDDDDDGENDDCAPEQTSTAIAGVRG